MWQLGLSFVKKTNKVFSTVLRHHKFYFIFAVFGEGKVVLWTKKISVFFRKERKIDYEYLF